MMCDNTWDAVKMRIIELENRETPVDAIDAGSDGNERYQCPVCNEWWYGQKNYCCQCGHKIRYR